MPDHIADTLQTRRVDNAVSHNTYTRTGQVSQETIQQLKTFYRPFNEKLVHLTGNADFLQWNAK